MEQAQKDGELQGLMVFMASLSHGLESVLGRGAKSVVFRAGRNVGMKVKVQKQSNDPLEALELVQEARALHPRDLGALSFLRTTMLAHMASKIRHSGRPVMIWKARMGPRPLR